MDVWQKLEGGEVCPDLNDVEELVLDLSVTDEKGIESLFDSGRIVLIFEGLEIVENMLLEAKEPEADILALQSAYLRAVKAVMGKVSGLQKLCKSAELVGRLALCLDSVDVSICTQVLELLAVLAVTSEDGYDSVRSSVEYFRIVRRESVRFESLVEALPSEYTPMFFKRDVMLFINTLVNSAPDVEQRIEMRAELVRAGVLEALTKLKEQTLAALSGSSEGLSNDAYELEVQLQVFETVLENDHKVALVNLEDEDDDDDDELDDENAVTQKRCVRLDSAQDLFRVVAAHAQDHDCDQHLLGVMQYLVAIPSYDQLGKEHWTQILRAAHRTVLGVDDDFGLGYDELKTVLSWKKHLEDRDATISQQKQDIEKQKKLITQLKDDQNAQKFKKEIDDYKVKLSDKEKEISQLQSQLKEASSKQNNGGAASSSSGGPAIDPKYAKFFKMLKMHIPRPAVEAKMRSEGLDPSILDHPPPVQGGSSTNGEDSSEASAKKPTGPILKDHPKYGKYISMFKMHIPRPAVEAKMRGEGLDPAVLSFDPMKPLPESFTGPPLKDHPKFGKYFKMLRMHLPKGAVGNKMSAEGLAPYLDLLDCDPEQPLPDKYKAMLNGNTPSTKSADKVKTDANKPKKANPKPRLPMRALFWSKIDDSQREKTVWKNLSDETIDFGTDLLDTLELEFAKTKKKSAEDEAEEKEKNEKKSEQPTKPKEVGLVDPKVSQNVGIALKKIKMSNADLFEAIVTLDEEKLDTHKTELLLKSCPTPEDAGVVAEWVSDPKNTDIRVLGQVESFFHVISPLPAIHDRIESMVFKQKLESTCATLDERLKTVTVACEKVSKSERLAKLLEIVLKLGNYLNGGTQRGGVFGYRLDVLAKLATVKSLDNTKTLMNWLVEWCDSRDPDLLNVGTDFPEITEAARCSLPQWQSDYTQQLETKIGLVDKHIKVVKNDKNVPKNDKFVDIMTDFKAEAAAEAEKLKHRFDATQHRFGLLVASFGEDPKSCGVEMFFKDLLGDFIAALHKAQQQNQKRRAMLEKAAQKKAAEDRKKELTAKSGELVTSTFNELKKGAADDILAKLQGPRQRRSRRNITDRDSAGNIRDSAISRDSEMSTQGSGPSALDASPQTDRMRKFIKRVHGVDNGSKAYERLRAFREKGEAAQSNTTTPPIAQSSATTDAAKPLSRPERANRAAEKLMAFRKKLEAEQQAAAGGGTNTTTPSATKTTPPAPAPAPPPSITATNSTSTANTTFRPIPTKTSTTTAPAPSAAAPSQTASNIPASLAGPRQSRRATLNNQPGLQALAGGSNEAKQGTDDEPQGELLRRLNRVRNRRRPGPGQS